MNHHQQTEFKNLVNGSSESERRSTGKLTVRNLKPKMTKRQELSCVQFELEELPTETILNIFSFLDIRGLLKCGHVSSRIRAISNDESLWLKLNLSGGNVPYELVEKAAKNGCKYLCLANTYLYGGENSKLPLNLKYLESCLMGSEIACKRLLQNCRSLEKLGIDNFSYPNITIISEDAIENIGKNGQTLKVLNLGCVDVDNPTKAIQKLFNSCVELNELSVEFVYPRSHTAMVNNLTRNIQKVHLGCDLKDEHVKLLVERCNKITELQLSFNSITKDSVDSIATHLNSSLEKLDVSHTKIDSTALLQLRSVGTLKVLICLNFEDDNADKDEDIEELKILRKNMPQVSINEEKFYIATSYKGPRHRRSYILKKGFWEIKAKAQKLFNN